MSPTTDLLEREAELEAAAAAFERARAGVGTHLVLVGEPGSGRSSLLAELRRMAGERGFAALAATASEAERDHPFGVARQLLEEVIVRAAADHREELLEGAAQITESLLTDPEPAGVPTDFPALNGLHRLVVNLAGRAPVLLAVDDVDQADEQSLLFLGYLTRRISSREIVVAMSAREWDVAGDSGAVEAVLSGPEAMRMRLAELGPAGALQVLARRLGREVEPRFAATCHRATDGNPGLLAELGDHLRAQAIEPVDANADVVRGAAPAALVRRLASRLSRLGEAEDRLARSLAVLGGEAELRDAAELARLDETATYRAIDSLALAGVVRTSSPAALRHPIFAAALRAAIPPAECANWQLEAAQLRADREADTADVAAHLLEAPPRRDAWTLERLRLAAREAIGRGEPDQAVKLLHRALAEPPLEDERSAVLLELGSAAARVGDARAVGLIQEAFETAGEPRARAEAALELAAALAYAGQSAAGVDALERALAELDDHRAPLAIQLLGLLLVLVTTTTTARRRAGGRLDEARSAVGSLDERSARVLLPSVAVDEATGRGVADQAAALGQRALAEGRLLAEHTADSPLPYLAAGALAWSDRSVEAERALDAAVEEAESRGSARGVAMARASRAYIRLLAGDVGGAREDALSLEADEGSLGDPSLSAFAMVAGASLVCSLVEAGRLGEAEREVRRFERLPHDPDALLVQPFRDARARLALARGDAGAALEQYSACRERQERWGSGASPAPVQWQAGAAVASLAAGHAAEGRRMAEDAVASARRFGAPRAIGAALRVRGLAASERAGELELEESVRVLERSSDRLEHARSLVELGAARRRAGSRSRSRDPLNEGMRIAAACGASVLADRAAQELRGSGAKPALAARTGPDELTPSERRVADLAATGRTNRQIALELFVTVKTVEMHLSNAYRKLEISSRRDLEAALV